MTRWSPACASATVRRPERAHLRPCEASLRSLAMPASRRYERCEQPDTRKPLVNSRVAAAPPTCGAASSTTTSRPARASVAAQTRPLWPAPTMAMRSRSVIGPALRNDVRTAEIHEHLARGVRARRGHHAAAGVRARPAHVEAPQRPAVLRVAREGAVEQELVHGQLALEDVALGQADLGFELARRAALDVAHERLEVRAVAADLVEHGVLEALAVGVGPLPAVDERRYVLDEHRHEVLSGRRHGRVRHRRD